MKNEPTPAIIDCAGVPALSTAVATTGADVEPHDENEATQNVNITAVMPSEDQKAYLFRICSGFARRFSR